MKLVALDDEPWRIEPWLEAVRNAFGAEAVLVRSDPIEALQLIRDPAVRVFVTDVMLPPDARLPAAVSGLVGDAVATEARRLRPDLGIFFLSQRLEPLPPGWSGRPGVEGGRKRNVTGQDLVAAIRRLAG